jgi:hypothetical protein
MIKRHRFNRGIIMDKYANIDLNKVYDYKELPDKIAGRCDNCGNKQFKSTVKNFEFIRECRQCGMKKKI